MSAWKRTENSNNVKPLEVDETSSNTVVYVRRNFTLVEETEERPEHYEYDEKEVNKGDWDTYKTIINHDTEISECQDALIELSEIIGG